MTDVEQAKRDRTASDSIDVHAVCMDGWQDMPSSDKLPLSKEAFAPRRSPHDYALGAAGMSGDQVADAAFDLNGIEMEFAPIDFPPIRATHQALRGPLSPLADLVPLVEPIQLVDEYYDSLPFDSAEWLERFELIAGAKKHLEAREVQPHHWTSPSKAASDELDPAFRDFWHCAAFHSLCTRLTCR
jgi:hypothetical protein